MTMEVRDYTEHKDDNSHYNGVGSFYGRLCKSQYDMQPKYCMPGPADGEMEGEHRNTQMGPKI